jgi:hypothetical protein
VWLKERQDATVALLPQRGQGRPDLGRVVRVVIDDAHVTGDADLLEPASGPTELPQHRPGLPTADTRQFQGRQCRRSVAPIVLARHAELAVVRLELFAAHDLRDLGEPPLEQLLDLRP